MAVVALSVQLSGAADGSHDTSTSYARLAIAKTQPKTRHQPTIFKVLITILFLVTERQRYIEISLKRLT